MTAATPTSTAALLERARCDEATVLSRLDSRTGGLTGAEVADRKVRFGPNQIARTKRRSTLRRLLDNIRNPLIILLLVLGFVSYVTGGIGFRFGIVEAAASAVASRPW